MRHKTLARIVLFASLTLTCGAPAQQSGRSVAPSPSPAWNDNSLITVRKTGGEPARPGDVKIEFFEHDAETGRRQGDREHGNRRPQQVDDGGAERDRAEDRMVEQDDDGAERAAQPGVEPALAFE